VWHLEEHVTAIDHLDGQLQDTTERRLVEGSCKEEDCATKDRICLSVAGGRTQALFGENSVIVPNRASLGQWDEVHLGDFMLEVEKGESVMEESESSSVDYEGC
jgi:hypothetical protein